MSLELVALGWVAGVALALELVDSRGPLRRTPRWGSRGGLELVSTHGSHPPGGMPSTVHRFHGHAPHLRLVGGTEFG